MGNFFQVLEPQLLRKDYYYKMIYMCGMYSVMVFLGPFVLILVLNYRIGMEIHRARLRRHSIVASNGVGGSRKSRTYSTSSNRSSAKRNSTSCMLNGSQRNRYICQYIHILKNILPTYHVCFCLVTI